MNQKPYFGILLILMSAGIIFGFRGCTKEKSFEPGPAPEMHYTSHNDLKVIDMNMRSIDVDGDGKNDFSFQVLPVGDPVLQRDRKQFYIYSKTHTALLNDANDFSPALVLDDRIMPMHQGFAWWEISAVVMAEKITPSVGIPTWEGNFVNASNKFVGFRMQKPDGYYYGWIQLSIDQDKEELKIHKSGIALKPDVVVKAGR